MLQEQKSNIVREDDKRASHIFVFSGFFSSYGWLSVSHFARRRAAPTSIGQ